MTTIVRCIHCDCTWGYWADGELWCAACGNYGDLPWTPIALTTIERWLTPDDDGCFGPAPKGLHYPGEYVDPFYVGDGALYSPIGWAVETHTWPLDRIVVEAPTLARWWRNHGVAPELPIAIERCIHCDCTWGYWFGGALLCEDCGNYGDLPWTPHVIATDGDRVAIWRSPNWIDAWQTVVGGDDVLLESLHVDELSVAAAADVGVLLLGDHR